MTEQEFQRQYLRTFTPSQLEAVRAVDGPVLLLAVPGSGKTTVLVTRLGYMTRCRGIDPERILTMTYTVAATGEMKQRFAREFGEDLAGRMEFRTINGISSKIISYYERYHGKDKAFQLLDNEAELSRIVARIYCDVTGEKYAPHSTVKDIRTGITYVKNMMLSGDGISRVDVGVEHFPKIYARYCEFLKGNRLMDYDDQMTYALLFLEKIPSVLEHFQNKYSYICVDEAQDTSKIQHEIIKLLASKSENLFMVGDEDQSIYGFRAAYPDALMDFERDHPGARVLMIEDNFRSTPEIVSLSNSFVAKNRFRRDKTIHPTKGGGEDVKVISALDREAQFDYLYHEAESLTAETAILYRNNDNALPLIDLFERTGVPYNCRNFDASFFSHRIVNDIRAIARFAEDPADADAFMQIYYKFDFPLSRGAAEYACGRSNETGKNILKELMAFPSLSAPAKAGVKALLSTFPEIPAANAENALNIILNGLQYRAYVEKNHLDNNKFFILRLLARGRKSIGDLMRRLDELCSLIQAHRNASKTPLTLSTIHSAKGLEFERVLLLDTIDGILPSKAVKDCKKNDDIRTYEEDRRLFYVAMTRAKTSLYLFSCADTPASFTSEAMAELPREVVSKTDVFAFLHENLLGRTYSSLDKGIGKITAQCGDRFLIKYSSGATELLSLSQMAEGRDKTAKYTPKKSEKAQIAVNTSNRIVSTQNFKVGKRVSHIHFGDGRITALTSSGSSTIATVVFEKSKETKRFMLQDVVKNKLLRLIN